MESVRSPEGEALFHRLNGAFQCDSDNDYGLVAEEIVEEFETLRKRIDELERRYEGANKWAGTVNDHLNAGPASHPEG